MAETLEKKTHEWEGLTEYKLSEDEFLNVIEGGVEEIIEVLTNMKVNQYFIISTMFHADNLNTTYFQRYINELKSMGIDLGKGDCQYGYKMPLPKNGEIRRELRVFRRK